MSPKRKLFPIDKTCEYCDKVFHAKSWYEIKVQTFCSRKCRSGVHGNGRPDKTFQRPCRNCGKLIKVVPSLEKTKHFCSYSCSSSFRYKGPGNGAWKGGNAKYWKRKARERDNFTCQFPGCGTHDPGKRIHAHHKIPQTAGGPDTLGNLITLCDKHHHTVEGRLLKELVKRHPESTQEISIALFEALSVAPEG